MTNSKYSTNKCPICNNNLQLYHNKQNLILYEYCDDNKELDIHNYYYNPCGFEKTSPNNLYCHVYLTRNSGDKKLDEIGFINGKKEYYFKILFENETIKNDIYFDFNNHIDDGFEKENDILVRLSKEEIFKFKSYDDVKAYVNKVMVFK